MSHHPRQSSSKRHYNLMDSDYDSRTRKEQAQESWREQPTDGHSDRYHWKQRMQRETERCRDEKRLRVSEEIYEQNWDSQHPFASETNAESRGDERSRHGEENEWQRWNDNRQSHGLDRHGEERHLHEYSGSLPTDGGLKEEQLGQFSHFSEWKGHAQEEEELQSLDRHHRSSNEECYHRSASGDRGVRSQKSCRQGDRRDGYKDEGDPGVASYRHFADANREADRHAQHRPDQRDRDRYDEERQTPDRHRRGSNEGEMPYHPSWNTDNEVRGGKCYTHNDRHDGHVTHSDERRSHDRGHHSELYLDDRHDGHVAHPVERRSHDREGHHSKDLSHYSADLDRRALRHQPYTPHSDFGEEDTQDDRWQTVERHHYSEDPHHHHITVNDDTHTADMHSENLSNRDRHKKKEEVTDGHRRQNYRGDEDHDPFMGLDSQPHSRRKRHQHHNVRLRHRDEQEADNEHIIPICQFKNRHQQSDKYQDRHGRAFESHRSTDFSGIRRQRDKFPGYGDADMIHDLRYSAIGSNHPGHSDTVPGQDDIGMICTPSHSVVTDTWFTHNQYGDFTEWNQTHEMSLLHNESYTSTLYSSSSYSECGGGESQQGPHYTDTLSSENVSRARKHKNRNSLRSGLPDDKEKGLSDIRYTSLLHSKRKCLLLFDDRSGEFDVDKNLGAGNHEAAPFSDRGPKNPVDILPELLQGTNLIMDERKKAMEGELKELQKQYNSVRLGRPLHKLKPGEGALLQELLPKIQRLKHKVKLNRKKCRSQKRELGQKVDRITKKMSTIFDLTNMAKDAGIQSCYAEQGRLTLQIRSVEEDLSVLRSQPVTTPIMMYAAKVLSKLCNRLIQRRAELGNKQKRMDCKRYQKPNPFLLLREVGFQLCLLQTRKNVECDPPNKNLYTKAAKKMRKKRVKQLKKIKAQRGGKLVMPHSQSDEALLDSADDGEEEEKRSSNNLLLLQKREERQLQKLKTARAIQDCLEKRSMSDWEVSDSHIVITGLVAVLLFRQQGQGHGSKVYSRGQDHDGHGCKSQGHQKSQSCRVQGYIWGQKQFRNQELGVQNDNEGASDYEGCRDSNHFHGRQGKVRRWDEGQDHGHDFSEDQGTIDNEHSLPDHTSRVGTTISAASTITTSSAVIPRANTSATVNATANTNATVNTTAIVKANAMNTSATVNNNTSARVNINNTSATVNANTSATVNTNTSATANTNNTSTKAITNNTSARVNSNTSNTANTTTNATVNTPTIANTTVNTPNTDTSATATNVDTSTGTSTTAVSCTTGTMEPLSSNWIKCSQLIADVAMAVRMKKPGQKDTEREAKRAMARKKWQRQYQEQQQLATNLLQSAYECGMNPYTGAGRGKRK